MDCNIGKRFFNSAMLEVALKYVNACLISQWKTLSLQPLDRFRLESLLESIINSLCTNGRDFRFIAHMLVSSTTKIKKDLQHSPYSTTPCTRSCVQLTTFVIKHNIDINLLMIVDVIVLLCAYNSWASLSKPAHWSNGIPHNVYIYLSIYVLYVIL